MESLHNERSGTDLVSANFEQILRFIAPDSYIIIEPRLIGVDKCNETLVSKVRVVLGFPL